MTRTSRNGLIAAAFLAPSIAGFLAFTLVPVITSGALSFFEWDLITAPRFIGIENYTKLLGFVRDDAGRLAASDPRFWFYLYNTLFLMLAIPLSMSGSLALALALNRRVAFAVGLRTIYFIPSMCVPVAVFLLWKWLLDGDYGLLNYLLARVGVKGPAWLASPGWAKPAIILVSMWAGIGGYNMILYLAGLQNIPRDLYEAATIDGAGAWRQFRHITWPLLTPTTFFVLVMSVIGGFQGGFEAAYMMTRGGPAGSTTTIGYYIYNQAYEWFNMGYAAAISWILFLLVLGVTLLNWKYGGRRVHY
ncbi:MAG: sugar ABC transporter permease [bacterium]|nr:sugar ABC transporter permease [Candidatus Sumerlaeota bacterium]